MRMIHSTAVIDKTAVIGKNVEIGAYSIIGKDVAIGDNAAIGSNSYIEYAEIGCNCKFYNSVSIGSAPQDLHYNGESSKVYVGEGTTVREFVTFNRGTKASGKTVIGKNCFFMACSHVGHDCIVGDNVIMANCSEAGGHVEIGDDAFVSANVGLHQFTKIGKGTMIGANTTVVMDIVPYATANGQRAVIEGLNIVGMKRRKMTAEQIKEVKDVYKILFSSGLLLKDAITEIEKYQSHFIKNIVDFIKDSKRGLARPYKSSFCEET
jgi:UDP-N-acetylglucosamine acyltransferase